MKSLLIDTSTSNVIVSVLDNLNVLNEYNEYINSDIASKIMKIIDECLTNSNLKIQDIDRIYVVNGPGSFTGIRIGVTIGKVIGWSLNKKIIPISSLELMSTTDTNKQYIIPMIDARRGNVFGAIYDTNLNCLKNDSLINIDELLNDKDSNYELVSYDKLRDDVVKPKINVSKLIEKHMNDNGINPHNLNPNYLKLTEAEENRLKSD